MKKLLVLLFTVVMIDGASAQHRVPVYRPHVIVTAPLYAPYYYPYSPFYAYPNPYAYGYGYNSRPSKLETKIGDIRKDYDDKIWSARQDDHLTGKQRRQTIRELKHERDNAIDELKKNYYKS